MSLELARQVELGDVVALPDEAQGGAVELPIEVLASDNAQQLDAIALDLVANLPVWPCRDP